MATRKSAKPAEEPAHELPYHVKYRPTKLEDVAGQKAIVGSLRAAVKAKSRQHTYFFVGPAGTGKTTLARIMAGEFGCSEVVEVDAASNSSVDNMRELLTGIRYQAFGGSGGKAFVIDECHRLSAQAWDTLLLTTEEPPEHVFFFFCSSLQGKIPKAMLTRGPVYELKPLRLDDLMDVLEYVRKQEALDVPDNMLKLVAETAAGSMRQALVSLATVQDCGSDAEIRELLQGQGENPQVFDLCRKMLRGPLAWGEVQAALTAAEDQSAEGIRIMVSCYMAKVLSTCSAKEAPKVLDIVEIFSKPCNATDKMAPIYLMFGEFIT